MDKVSERQSGNERLGKVKVKDQRGMGELLELLDELFLVVGRRFGLGRLDDEGEDRRGAGG